MRLSMNRTTIGKYQVRIQSVYSGVPFSSLEKCHFVSVHGSLPLSSAAAFLQEDIEMVETHVTRLVTVDLEQHQWDALISWCFNLGCGNLRSSTMLQVINRGEIDQVTSELIRWDKSNGKALAGLTRRRKSEATLFDKGELDYGKVKDNG